MSSEMKPIPLTLIVAATPSHAIGRSSALPWRLPKEMAYFARVTKGEQPEQDGLNAVIMGRKSWEGIPARWRPLQGRINVVVSRQDTFDLGDAPHSHRASSLPSAVSLLSSIPSNTGSPTPPKLNRTFLIGGAQLYSHGLTAPHPSYTADRILLTRLKTDFPDCDAFLPPIPSDTEGEWKQATHKELCEWVGWEVPEGDQTEKDRTGGGDVVYEFQMWTREPRA